LGYWLGEPYWGRGIITEAVQWISDYAFSHYEYIRLFAGVFPDNVASKKVLEKCGYALECIRTKALVKYDTIYDEWVYVKFKPEA
jgi:RimJ/RimL family protein N-acetyltransferase